MADNTVLASGSGGDTIATDDIAGVKYPRSKIVIGADGSNDGDVSATNPMPVKGTGTAGTANSGVVTVQGIAAMTPVLTTLSGTNNIATVTTLTTCSTVSSVTALGTVTPGTAATNLGKAIDVAAGASDVGVAALAIRDDALTTLTPVDGDYVPLRVNSTGALHVTASNAAAVGTAGTAAADVLTVQGIASMTPLLATPSPATSGGLSIARDIDLDNSTLTVVKAAAGQLYGWHITNTSTATVFVKFYNATSGTLGTGTPVLTIGIPGNATDDTLAIANMGDHGIAFSTGICVGAGTGVADADNTDPGANAVVANIYYK
jgi:hypothetical protein